MKRKSIKFAAMTMYDAERLLNKELSGLYDAREASNIADLVMENLSGLKKIDRLIARGNEFSHEHLLNTYIGELKNHKPVQYVLNEAWFFEWKFFVDERVLIPRPETEELVQWVVDENKGIKKILDIGTGSGCIPVALKKKWQETLVSACDVSEGALEVAKKNAFSMGAEVRFFLMDLMERSAWQEVSEFDIIVSNPPYIPLRELYSMADHVVRYEPHLALFVKNEDPLIFYRLIGELGKDKLSAGGRIYVETHEDLAKETAEVFVECGFGLVEVRKDLQGKERMLRVMR